MFFTNRELKYDKYRIVRNLINDKNGTLLSMYLLLSVDNHPVAK